MRSLAVSLIVVAVVAACEVAPVPTDAPPPTPASSDLPGPWEEVWTPDGSDEYRWITSYANALEGRSDEGLLELACSKGFHATQAAMLFEMPTYRDRLATAEAPRGYYKDEATAIAWVKRNYEIDDVFISRRNMGEVGRWEKSGWKDVLTDSGLLLRNSPADAFITQLAQVEELAVLITDDDGNHDIQAIFDVRHLREALASDQTDWDCALPS